MDYWNQQFDKRLILSLTLLITIVAIGTIGYHIIEGMSYFDGFYMTFITISTIGFGEIKKLTIAGRVLTIIISVMGIGVIAYIATHATQSLLETFLFRERQLKRRIGKMKNHYIVCGYGRIGRRIVEELKQANLEVVIVDNNDDVIDKISELGHTYVNGGAQHEETLVDAGIKEARALICTLSRDEDNVFVTLVARELNPDLFILVRTNQQQNLKKILRAGADKVISPYGIGADRMANVILKPHVDMFIDKLTKDELEENAFEELEISNSSLFVEKTLAELNVRQNYSVLIVGVIPHETGQLIFNPSGTYLFRAGDVLVVLGESNQINTLKNDVCKGETSIEARNRQIDSFLKKTRKNTV